MLSYIRSELYRLLRNKSTYLFILICSGLLISANIVLAAVNASESGFPYASTKYSLGFFYTSLNYVFVICIAVASMVFGNEHTNHTMKNSISYGISRGYIYFGKLIVEIIYSMIAFTLITVAHISSAYLLLENSGTLYLEQVFQASFVAIPLFLFVLAAANCFIFIIDSTGGGIAAIIGVVIVFPQMTNLLGMKFKVFRDLTKILPWSMMNNIGFDAASSKLLLPWEGSAGYINYWFFGICEMLMITIMGYLVFRKKEIK